MLKIHESKLIIKQITKHNFLKYEYYDIRFKSKIKN